MNTLIFDLRNLVDNHLSLLEDLFLNYQNHSKPKNVKISIRMKNWKSMLYYIQRYEYQTSILVDAYAGACQLGDRNLMERLYPHKVFDPKNFKLKMLKHLARGGCYDLIDGLIDNLKCKHTHFCKQHMDILVGLVARGDLEMIKSNKYFCCGIIDMLVFICKVYKYNHKEIIDYCKCERLDVLYRVETKTITDKDIKLIKKYDGTIYYRTILNILIKNKDTDLINKLGYDRSSYYFADKLIASRWLEELEPMLENKSGNAIIRNAAIKNDNLELYIKTYRSTTWSPYDIMLILQSGAYMILEYVLKTYPVNIGAASLPPVINDPRIARMVVDYCQSNTPQFNLNEMIMAANRHNHDEVAKIMLNYNLQR